MRECATHGAWSPDKYPMCPECKSPLDMDMQAVNDNIAKGRRQWVAFSEQIAEIEGYKPTFRDSRAKELFAWYVRGIVDSQAGLDEVKDNGFACGRRCSRHGRTDR